ncbi:hypothetical protein P8C59_006479 [Phyllachora maydis]|uniref:Uncharacterized protein n=1 Tax=Phyllachora maydis TaxID=1825666 RepID=A0AAD9I6Y0_9PEZI|nr:hypothetical protein P8C59_006479 [Phyllachora maydis]
MYIYIACLPYYCYYYDLSCTNLLIADIDSLSNSNNLVHTIPAPIPAKPAKIIPAIRRAAAYKAKRRKSAKAYTIVGRAAAAKRYKNGNASRYTTNSGLTANKDNNNAYNGAYIPPANTEEEEGGSSDDNGVNSGISDSTDKGEGGGIYKRGKGASCYKDILLYKRQRVTSYPYGPPSTPYADIYVYYI